MMGEQSSRKAERKHWENGFRGVLTSQQYHGTAGCRESRQSIETSRARVALVDESRAQGSRTTRGLRSSRFEPGCLCELSMATIKTSRLVAGSRRNPIEKDTARGKESLQAAPGPISRTAGIGRGSSERRGDEGTPVLSPRRSLLKGKKLKVAQSQWSQAAPDEDELILGRKGTRSQQALKMDHRRTGQRRERAKARGAATSRNCDRYRRLGAAKATMRGRGAAATTTPATSGAPPTATLEPTTGVRTPPVRVPAAPLGGRAAARIPVATRGGEAAAALAVAVAAAHGGTRDYDRSRSDYDDEDEVGTAGAASRRGGGPAASTTQQNRGSLSEQKRLPDRRALVGATVDVPKWPVRRALAVHGEARRALRPEEGPRRASRMLCPRRRRRRRPGGGLAAPASRQRGPPRPRPRPLHRG